MILFAANFDRVLVVNAAFNAAEANLANIAGHNAQKEKRQCRCAQQSGDHQQGSFGCVSQHEGPIASPAEKTEDYQLVEVGLLGIRGSFFPRPFGGSF